MASPWVITNFPSTATVATAGQVVPASAKAVGQVTRLRSLQVSVATGATAQTPLQWVVRDGATGAGTIIATGALSAPANSVAAVDLTGLDLRASLGNAITVEFTAAGVSASQQAVSAQGDYVAHGAPLFITSG